MPTIKPRVPMLLVSIARETAILPNLTITVDGAPFAQESWEHTVPMDPGEHIVEATAPGKRSWRQTINVREAVTLTVSVPALEVYQQPSPEAPASVIAVDRKNRPNKTVVIVGGVASGAALIMGTGFLAGSFMKAGERDSIVDSLPKNGLCPTQHRDCPLSVVNANAARVTFANASFYAFIAAGVLGGATLTYALWPRRQPTDVTAAFLAGPGGASVVVTGQW